MELKPRSLHTGWESDEFHLSNRVRSSLKVEPSHSTEPIFDMNFDGRSVNRLAVRAPYCEFKGTRASTAVDDGNFFIGRWRLSPRK